MDPVALLQIMAGNLVFGASRLSFLRAAAGGAALQVHVAVAGSGAWRLRFDRFAFRRAHASGGAALCWTSPGMGGSLGRSAAADGMRWACS